MYGAMAECYFDMPIMLLGECLSKLGDDMREVVKQFDSYIGRKH